jgi:hypothetical protein
LLLLTIAALIYFLAFAGKGEESAQTPTSDRSLSRAERLARMDARLDRMETADRNSERGEFERTTDPGGNWTADLPGGSRWTEPEDQGDQNTPDNPRYRTVFWGPDGAFVLIESTPYEDPIQNEMNYTIDGIRYPATPLDDARMDYAEMIEFEAASGDCAGLSCAKVLTSDGVGGGIAVLVGSENVELSQRVASRIGSSISTDR